MSNHIFECPFAVEAGSLDARFKRLPWCGELLLATSGGMPTLRTRFKSLWDNERLSFLFDCEDTDIRATYKEPNSKVWMEEAVELFIAPCNEDPDVYFEFQLSPANVSRQVRVTVSKENGQPLTFDDSWRCPGLKTETRIHGYLNEPKLKSEGWEGIFSVPFNCLIGPEGTVDAGTVWRINLFRIDRWPEEMFAAWSPTFHDPPLFHSRNHFGRMLFTKIPDTQT